MRRPVGTPDSVQVLAVLANGARAVYHFSGVTPFGQEMGDPPVRQRRRAALRPGRRPHPRRQPQQGATPGRRRRCRRSPIPAEKARRLARRGRLRRRDPRRARRSRFTDFATGVAYMEFTEAVARSARPRRGGRNRRPRLEAVSKHPWGRLPACPTVLKRLLSAAEQGTPSRRRRTRIEQRGGHGRHDRTGPNH